MIAIPVCIPTNNVKMFPFLTLVACILFDDTASQGVHQIYYIPIQILYPPSEYYNYFMLFYFILMIFFIIVYFKILNIVPCAIQ